MMMLALLDDRFTILTLLLNAQRGNSYPLFLDSILAG